MSPGSRQIENQPLALEDTEAIAELRGLLSGADYTASGIAHLLGLETVTLSPAEIPVHERRLIPDNQLSTLIGLFLLGLTVDTDQAGRVLGALPLRRLERLGLLESTVAGIRARVELFPYQSMVLACDRKRLPGEAQEDRDYVLGMSPSTDLLARLTLRRRVGATLDLGTGCGVQALIAAKHSERVVGVDINARALNFAAFNAQLNGISNVEWRQGSVFDPVRGQSFDLIVCNPPFIVGPAVETLYRDSGLSGDALCRQIVSEAPGFLNQGGFAQVEVSWIFAPDQAWSEPLRGWVAGTGCDAWLLHYRTVDPLTYAADSIRPMWGDDFARYREVLDRWIAYYRRLHIEALGVGTVILRRRSGKTNWIRADELPDPVRPSSDHILRVFQTLDYLQGMDGDQEFLKGVFGLVEDQSLQQALVCRDGRWQTEEMALALHAGLAYRGKIDAPTALLLSRLDGRRSLGEIVSEVALSKGITGAALESFTAGAARSIRVLLELGFVVPSSPPVL
jgi:hypothetical protein